VNDSELEVIGSVILDPGCFADMARVVREDDFVSARHQAAWSAIRSLVTEGVPVDELMIATRMPGDRSAALEYVASVAEQTVTATGHMNHAIAVAANGRKKRLMNACALVIRDAKDKVFFSKENAETWFAEMAARLDVSAVFEPSNVIPMREAIRDTLKTLEDRTKLKGAFPGMRSGYAKLDEHLLGYQLGHLCILAGKPAAGKTALALNIAVNIAKAGNAALVCSHEMGVTELVSRILSSESRVAGTVMEMGSLDAGHYARLAPAGDRLKDLPLLFSKNPPRTISALMAEVQQQKRKHDLKMVVVDYLQLMESSDAKKNREQAVAEISRGMKRIAMELNVCVLALSQLNRNSDRNSEPSLSELRESGSLEQDANSVVMLWAEKDDAPQVWVKVAKNRSGLIGSFGLKFGRATQRFEDLPS